LARRDTKRKVRPMGERAVYPFALVAGKSGGCGPRSVDKKQKERESPRRSAQRASMMDIMSKQYSVLIACV
jgi:hypothetical protein